MPESSAAIQDFTESDIQVMLDNLDKYTPQELSDINTIVDELSTRTYNQRAYDDLIAFCQHMQPDYTVGKHHRILADMLMDGARGSLHFAPSRNSTPSINSF